MGINSFPDQSGGSNEIDPMLIDPVSKFRVSNPENLIDTDFEYGLQPTKWETVEIINNTPAFFSKGGDTTIPDITGITTSAGTREITVTTAFDHGLAVGIPIRVDGTKSITADGSYIINATPSLKTFTYLSRANQPDTISIFDLYTSIITGEFFQGSQISIADSEGIVTDNDGPISKLTVKTKNKHGFGLNTPFYFLNLNSTISQEFESQNTASVSFDPTNSAVAQNFDGSNTQLQTPIDLSNSASTSGFINPITATSIANNTITVSLTTGDIWSELKVGAPLYYNVSAVSGYFYNNPRGVVFIKDISGINQAGNTATFDVSTLPNGEVIDITSGMSGFFQIADQAKTFPGNNVDEETQIEINLEIGQEFVFDGGNQGYAGTEVEAQDNTLTVTSYNETQILASGLGPVEHYVGAMLQYTTTGTAATNLVDDATYFVTEFNNIGDGDFTLKIADLPGGAAKTISGGTGTQTFSPIGVSIDKDIIHVKNSDFRLFEMIEYRFPVEDENENPIEGNLGADINQKFYFVVQKFDQHNYKVSNVLGLVSPATQTRTETDAGTPIAPTQVNITGFTQPYSFAVTSGTLPAGLTLNTATGVISGTPTSETATRVVVITLTDVNGVTGSQSITFQFNPQPFKIPFDTTVFGSVRNYLAARVANYKNPGFYEYNLDSTNQINDGGGDMYDGGNRVSLYVNGSRSGDLSYSTANTTAFSSPTQVRYGSLGNTRPIFHIGFGQTDSTFRWGFGKDGNLGADNGGSQSNYYAYNNATVGNFTNVYAWIRVVFNAGDPSVGDVYIAASHPLFGQISTITGVNVASAAGNTDSNFSQFEVTGRNHFMAAGLLSRPGGGFISTSDVQQVTNTILNDLQQAITLA